MVPPRGSVEVLPSTSRLSGSWTIITTNSETRDTLAEQEVWRLYDFWLKLVHRFINKLVQIHYSGVILETCGFESPRNTNRLCNYTVVSLYGLKGPSPRTFKVQILGGSGVEST